MKKRNLMSIFACGAVILSIGQASALEPMKDVAINNSYNSSISPYMDYIARANANIYVSKGEATISCSVYGYQGITTSVKIDAKLQQYKNGKWVSIDTFSKESNSYRVSIDETSSITKGYKYRVQATIKAYSGSKIETRTVTSSEAKY